MKKPKKYKPSAEREMRDRMNGIIRDAEGNITHRYGKPVATVANDEASEKTE